MGKTALRQLVQPYITAAWDRLRMKARRMPLNRHRCRPVVLHQIHWITFFTAIFYWHLTGTTRAQLIEQLFPNDIPGYAFDQSDSVANRMEIQNEPDGIEIGNFVIRPELNELAGYNSNTLGAPRSGSAEIETNASLQADSEWTRNSLNMSLDVDDLRYPSVPGASYTNWSAGAGGSINLGNDTLSLSYKHQSLHLAATSIGAIGVVTPVPFSVDNLQASYEKLFGRFSLTPLFEFANFAFGQGGLGDQDAYHTLSHRVETAGLIGRFETAPGDAVVLVVRPSFAQFGQNPSDNYTDIAGFAGIDVRGERIIQYRFLFGVEQRSFAAHTTPSVTTPTFELTAIWTPTELDTITATGVHRLDDPTSPFASDQELLDGRVELDHELRRNVFLVGYAEGARTTSRIVVPSAATVAQTQVNAGASAVWNFTQYLSATVSYGYTLNRTDNGAANGVTASGYQNFSSSNILFGIRLNE